MVLTRISSFTDARIRLKRFQDDANELIMQAFKRIQSQVVGKAIGGILLVAVILRNPLESISLSGVAFLKRIESC